MSFKAMAWAWKQERYKGNRKLVLLAIADYANEDNDFEFRPAYSAIAKKCGISRRHVITIMNEFEDCGLIKKHFRKAGQGDQTSNIYALNLTINIVVEHSGGGEHSSLGGEHSSLGVVKTVHQGGEDSSPRVVKTVHPEPVNINLLLEPNKNIRSNPKFDPLFDLSKNNRPTKRPNASRFNEFWVEYPRKVKRKTALEIWKRKQLDGQADVLIADVSNRKRNHDPWLKGFIPDPTTYLNQERWQDEITLVIGDTHEQRNRSFSQNRAGLTERQRALAALGDLNDTSWAISRGSGEGNIYNGTIEGD